MRPAGEIRQALRAAFAEREHATWREVLGAVPGVNGASPAERALVRRTVVNMVHCGELVRCGAAKVAGSGRWHAVYGLAGASDASGLDVPQPWGGIETLTEAMRGVTRG